MDQSQKRNFQSFSVGMIPGFFLAITLLVWINIGSDAGLALGLITGLILGTRIHRKHRQAFGLICGLSAGFICSLIYIVVMGMIEMPDRDSLGLVIGLMFTIFFGANFGIGMLPGLAMGFILRKTLPSLRHAV